jgi:hypothetical protein
MNRRNAQVSSDRPERVIRGPRTRDRRARERREWRDVARSWREAATDDLED